MIFVSDSEFRISPLVILHCRTVFGLVPSFDTLMDLSLYVEQLFFVLSGNGKWNSHPRYFLRIACFPISKILQINYEDKMSEKQQICFPHLLIKLEWNSVELISLSRPKSPLKKPHANSLHPDWNLDLHQIPHTHKYQSTSHALLFFF